MDRQHHDDVQREPQVSGAADASQHGRQPGLLFAIVFSLLSYSFATHYLIHGTAPSHSVALEVTYSTLGQQKEAFRPAILVILLLPTT